MRSADQEAEDRPADAVTGSACARLARSRACLTAATIAEQRSTSSDLLTLDAAVELGDLPHADRFSSGIGIAWPGWYWVDFSSIRAFWPLSTRSRSSRLAVRKQAGGDWHYRASVTA